MHAENTCALRTIDTYLQAVWANSRLISSNQGKNATQCIVFWLGIFLFKIENALRQRVETGIRNEPYKKEKILLVFLGFAVPMMSFWATETAIISSKSKTTFFIFKTFVLCNRKGWQNRLTRISILLTCLLVLKDKKSCYTCKKWKHTTRNI